MEWKGLGKKEEERIQGILRRPARETSFSSACHSREQAEMGLCLKRNVPRASASNLHRERCELAQFLLNRCEFGSRLFLVFSRVLRRSEGLPETQPMRDCLRRSQ